MPGPMGSGGLVVDVESDLKAVATRAGARRPVGSYRSIQRGFIRLDVIVVALEDLFHVLCDSYTTVLLTFSLPCPGPWGSGSGAPGVGLGDGAAVWNPGEGIPLGKCVRKLVRQSQNSF